MVSKTTRTAIFIGLASVSPYGNASSTFGDELAIQLIEIEKPEQTILPGEPFSVLMHVGFASDYVISPYHDDPAEVKSPMQAAVETVCRTLSLRVEINGRIFRNRLSHGFLNDAAEFSPLSSSAAQILNGDLQKVTCLVSFFLAFDADADELDFAFRESGDHRIVFQVGGIEAELQVAVEHLKENERRLFGQLGAKEILYFLADVEDCSKVDELLLNRLESLYSQSQGSRYRRILGIVRGLAGQCELTRDYEARRAALGNKNHSRAEIQQLIRENRRNIAELGQYFEGVSTAAPTSKLDLLGRWYLGRTELAKAELASSDSEFQEHLDRFDILAKGICECPLAPSYLVRRAQGHAGLIAEAKARRARQER